MSAKKAVQEFIKEGGQARIETRDGVEGVLFLDEMYFIPLENLGYNSELGFFNTSIFPDQPNNL